MKDSWIHLQGNTCLVILGSYHHKNPRLWIRMVSVRNDPRACAQSDNLESWTLFVIEHATQLSNINIILSVNGALVCMCYVVYLNVLCIPRGVLFCDFVNIKHQLSLEGGIPKTYILIVSIAK